MDGWDSIGCGSHRVIEACSSDFWPLIPCANWGSCGVWRRGAPLGEGEWGPGEDAWKLWGNTRQDAWHLLLDHLHLKSLHHFAGLSKCWPGWVWRMHLVGDMTLFFPSCLRPIGKWRKWWQDMYGIYWCQVQALWGFNVGFVKTLFNSWRCTCFLLFGCCDRYDYRKNLMDYDYQNFIKASWMSHPNNGYMDVAWNLFGTPMDDRIPTYCFEIWTQICGSLGTQIVSHDHVVVSGGVLRFSWSDVLTILTTWLGFGWSGVRVGAELGWFMHFIQPSKDHDDKWFETRNPPRPIIILNHLQGTSPWGQPNTSSRVRTFNIHVRHVLRYLIFIQLRGLTLKTTFL